MSQNIVREHPLYLALEVAEVAANEAGRYLMEKQWDVHVVHKKDLRDDLLDADLESEAIILKKLKEHFPDYNILSEEAGEENLGSNYQWVVDPLDGSANFQHGSPTFAIAISLRVNTITELGVIYLPIHDEMFTAIRGYGANCNHRPIYISQTHILDKAIIHAGDFTKNGDREENQRRLTTLGRLSSNTDCVRMIGTASTDLAYVACGRSDGLVMYDLNLWDIDAGRLLVTEAGGTFSIHQDHADKVQIIGSNGILHDQLIQIALKQDVGV